ncbi:MAG: amino acid adenylation domain-containing protein [Acidobacteriota bacterium]
MQNETIEGYRLSPQQERLWLLQQAAGGGLPQRAAGAILIEGELSPEILKAALSRVVEQHEILRTAFELLSAMTVPVQVIADRGSSSLSQYDCGVTAVHGERGTLESLLLKASEQQSDFSVTEPKFSLAALSADRHVLLIDLPPLCADRMGLYNLMREIGHAYLACLKGEESPYEPIQYADLSEWLNELLESDEMLEGREFWRQKGASQIPILKLPFEMQAAEAAGFKLQTQSLAIAQSTVEAIDSLALENGATPATFLLACWQVLLCRLLGQPEVVVGIASNGRKHDQLKEALGLFAKHLPLSASLEGDLPFISLWQRVDAEMREVDRWQDYFAWEQLGAGSDGDEISYFSFAFEFAKANEAMRVDGLRFTMVSQQVVFDRFDIKLTCEQQPDHSLRAELAYDAGLYEQTDIDRLVGWLQRLIESTMCNPHAAVDRLEILDEEERRRLLVDFNRTTAEYGPENRLPKLVEAQVARTPQRVAVLFEQEELRYDELNRKANQLAHHLQHLGVGPDVPVGILVDRSLDMLVGILGILKAGGAYVPLDPDYPQERLAFMMEDAGIAVLLTAEQFVDVLPQTPVPLVRLDLDWDKIASESDENPDSIITADNLAYVIYTSGSTGKPKGVMITHRAIVNRLLWMQMNYPLTADDRVLQKTVISFDASVWELFMPLLAGAQIILARRGGHKDSKYLIEAVRQQQVTTLQLVPSMLAVMVEEAELEQCLSLRQMWCGGEALPAEVARRFHERSRAVLHNLYGPTEASIDATHCEVKREWEGRAVVSIGRPIGNMQCHILDRYLQPVPPGVAGELFIGGVGLARGYWKRADLTAERFIPNPFGEASARLYRTGDLAQYQTDGRIEFLGRLDHQVKIRGYRIELGEIEALLTQHRGVRAAVVAAREESNGEKRLVAYVVPEQGNAPLASNGMQPYLLPNQLEIVHLNKNETDLLYKEIFQDQVYLKHGITLNDGDSVFDVGANISFFTLFVHQRCRDARVYAFEPIPPIFQVLQANVNHYGLNTTLFKCGLGQESGMATFTFYPKSSAMSGRYADAAEDERVIRAFMSRQDDSLTEYADELMAGRLKSESYDCQVRTLSEIIAEQNIAQVDLLKIDVEKSELDVLKGIKESDWEKIKQIVIEVHDIRGRLAQISELLESHGYKLTVEQDSSFDATTGVYNIYAIHRSRHRAQEKTSGETLRPVRYRAGLSVQEVNDYLRDKLPEYMMPSAIVVLAELPLTANGKVDRRALPEAGAAGSSTTVLAAAHSPLEEILVGIWAEVLRVERVGINDNFFELGGHSLLATRLVSRVRHQLSLEVPLHTLFEAPTISGFAARVEELLGFDRGSARLPELVADARPARLPLSYAQQRLWFFDQLQPHSAAYNLPLAVRLRGRLELAELVRSLNRVIERHESLRTSFVMEDGEPSQVIAAELELALPVFDVSELGAAERELEAAQLLAAEAAEGFDLSRGPLLRAKVIKLGEQEHIASLTMHHIISDGWSLGVLIRELAAFYNAAVDESSSELRAAWPPLPLQYADYALWQREWLSAGALESQLTYWREQLAGAPVLELPADKSRPLVQSMRGGQETFRFSAELTAQLRALALREGATLFMVLLAVFEVLLARYSGQRDLVVGTPIANRNRYETEELIGFFVNMLALRVKLEERESFRELVRAVREVTLAGYANQDVPFEKIVEELEPERDTSRQPIFQVMFALQNMPQEKPELSGLESLMEGANSGVTKMDLGLVIQEVERGLIASFEYSTELFEAETIRRMGQHWKRLCEEVVRDSEQRLGEMELLRAGEREQLVAEWNRTAVEYADEKCCHELFEEQALLRPEATAVVDEDSELSYGELNRQANQLAHYLRGLGVEPEVRVGLLLDRGVTAVVAILGILKAGGAYVPLDPAYPKERLIATLEDAGVALVLTHRQLHRALPEHAFQVIRVDEEREKISRQEAHNPRSGVQPRNLAYVIYTSGSTGRPKGVLLEHRGVCNLAEAQRRAFSVSKDDRVLQFASLSFDASVSEIFVTLLAGATLCLAKQDSLMPGPDLLDLLRRQSITEVTLPSSVLAVMEAASLPDLHTIVSAGEACAAETAARWGAGRRFINAYGPTEVTVCATIALEVDGRRPPIGRPMSNMKAYILDAHLRPVPIGVVGELYVGGIGVARGYSQQPELTARKFIPDSHGPEPGARMYKTGDLARYLPDGQIEFLGRMDNQVKIRGYRVELSEIESRLNEHRGVQDAVVVLREDVKGDQRLIAYLVPQRETGATDIELWPSVAEYFIYDEVLYYAMTNDERRNQSYRVALERAVKDKVAVDIGTGPDAILARLCLEAGARKVYAIELLEDTYRRAAATIKSLELEDRIVLINGDSTQVQLPEPVDVCVSEIVGPIGGVEGAAVILNDARRFLTPAGRMIPQRSLTMIAPVSLPAEFVENPGFSDMTRGYVEKVFEHVGYKFDLRLSLKGVKASHLISNSDVFEDLEFTDRVAPEYCRKVNFEISRDARMDGFLVWLKLYTDESEVIDILKHEHSWLPVYLPVFYPGIEVNAGDTITATITARLCQNKLNPNYQIAGQLRRGNGESIDFSYASTHHDRSYRQSALYERLFADEKIAVRQKNEGTKFNGGELSSFLEKFLPSYMIPSSFITLETLPLTPNGKLDLRALPAPEQSRPDLSQTFVAPRTVIEEMLSQIWAEVLRLELVGIHDNFFQLGGHSLLATQLFSRLRSAFQVELPLRSIFHSPTVAGLTQALIENEVRPGQTEKIALLMKKVKSMPAADMVAVLNEKKKRAKGEIR